MRTHCGPMTEPRLRPSGEKGSTMRTIRHVLIACVAAAMLFLASPASAGNAHFIGNATSATLDGFNLNAKFKEAGLESGSVETITVSADFEGTFQCINGGGSNPNDGKKTVIRAEL